MSRSEIRRKKREEEKKKKTYVMTADEIEKIRKQEWERAKKIHEQEMNEISDNIFLMMLSIPVNVLVSASWQKSAM